MDYRFELVSWGAGGEGNEISSLFWNVTQRRLAVKSPTFRDNVSWPIAAFLNHILHNLRCLYHVSVILPVLHIRIICMLFVPEEQAGEAWKAWNKAVLFWKWGSTGHKGTLLRLKRSAETI
jgi:hypothetical protein